MTVSVRSYLAAGLVTATLGAVAVVPVTLPRTDVVHLPSIELTAAVSPFSQPAATTAGAVLGIADAPGPAAAATAVVDPAPIASATGSAGDTIINAYNAIQPWVQWGFEVAAWAVSYFPWPIGWLGQQINIAYNTGEPIVQALVYSFAYLIDGQFDLIGPTLTNGVTTAVNNLVKGEIAWVLSFFPPLPPVSFPVFPVFPAAAAASRTAAAPAAARMRPTAAVSDGIAPTTDAGTAHTDAAEATTAEVTTAEATTAEAMAIEAPRTRRGVSRGSSTRAHQAKPDVAAQSTAGATDIAPQTTIAAEATDAPAAAAVTEHRKASRASVRTNRSGSREG